MSELETVEFWENHYLDHIEFTLKQDILKMLDGLKSKDKIKEDWTNIFKQSADKNSDFSRGAERIYYWWLFNKFGIPNSSPIGADMFFETQNAFVHIDVKTAKLDNMSDFKGKIPVGCNQTSYKSDLHNYEVNLPTHYSHQNKICLTYFINIIYKIENDNIEIGGIYVICVPNGKLFQHYGAKIIGSGKSGYIRKGFRYIYSNSPHFELLAAKPLRIRRIFLADDLISKEFDLIKVKINN
ncbi:MAG: hypothetical protein EAZ85_08405 [Bacteroidetes bacterium]|nr:MAG: hypothetical protein EAZ85_08405 [Bacteroidota bacterium]